MLHSQKNFLAHENMLKIVFSIKIKVRKPHKVFGASISLNVDLSFTKKLHTNDIATVTMDKSRRVFAHTADFLEKKSYQDKSLETQKCH